MSPIIRLMLIITPWSALVLATLYGWAYACWRVSDWWRYNTQGLLGPQGWLRFVVKLIAHIIAPVVLIILWTWVLVILCIMPRA